MKRDLIGITRVLAISGCTDFAWVDEEAKFRGSEVHKIIELSSKNTLDRGTVIDVYKGYLRAHDKFMAETRFLPTRCEVKVQNLELGIRGRLDCVGLMKGKQALVEWKSGAVAKAVALQLCLGGHLLDPSIWYERYAVQLKKDGTYSVKHWSKNTWHADLATALAAARVSRWKVVNGLA